MDVMFSQGYLVQNQMGSIPVPTTSLCGCQETRQCIPVTLGTGTGQGTWSEHVLKVELGMVQSLDVLEVREVKMINWSREIIVHLMAHYNILYSLVCNYLSEV